MAMAESGRPERRRRWVAVVVVILAIGMMFGLLVGRGGGGGKPPSSTPTTVAPTPSTALPSTTSTVPTTTTTSAPAALSAAVYPYPGSTLRFGDPVEAARSFTIDFVGFVDPVVGSYVAHDADSGKVDVRPSANGPVTVVAVRRLSGSWWVTGTATANIQVAEPAALQYVSSPVHLRGVSTAFEATVGVEVRQDGSRPPIGEGWVNGGANGEMGPFDGSVLFADPTSAMGAVVMLTRSMENGQVWEATVVRIGLVPGGVEPPTSACPVYSMPTPQPGAGQMLVTVFYSCDIDALPVPTYRLSAQTSGVLRAALEQELAGPAQPERLAGLQSFFSSATAGMLASVTVDNGAAVVDFHDLRTVIPNASASAGSQLLVAQLDATVFQFPTVKSVVYRIDGSCESFTEWLQVGGCQARVRPG